MYLLKSCNQDQALTMEVGNHRKRERMRESKQEKLYEWFSCIKYLSSVLYIWGVERQETKTENN